MPAALTFSITPLEYVPASLRHDTNGWYVVYYQFNHLYGNVERKRVRLNALRKRCHTQIQFRMQVDELIRTINNKMIADLTAINQIIDQSKGNSQSITPIQTTTPERVQDEPAIDLTKVESVRYLTPIVDMIDIYIEEKEKSTRAATFRSYKSFCKRFKQWMMEHYPQCRCAQFKRPLAVEFLDDLSNMEGIGNRTYNNNVKMATALFSWAVKKCYISENPFEGQEKKVTLEKNRTIIPANAQMLIDDWFKENNPAMRIVTRMVYTSLLRPVEISRVQVNQIDFENHCIHMTGDKTKNKHGRDSRMDLELEDMLRKHIKGAFPTDYLFCLPNWGCGSKPRDPNSYTKEWERMRSHLLDEQGNKIIPDKYQLYSLRDTSINGMLKNNVDNLSVMQAAGHRDLKMTLIYANHADPKLIENLNQKAPKFAHLG